MKEADVKLRSTIKEDGSPKLIMPRFNTMKRMQHDEDTKTRIQIEVLPTETRSNPLIENVDDHTTY